MNLSAACSVLGWLIRDTFRQALWSGVFWLLLAVTGLCTVFCLGVGYDYRDVVDRARSDKSPYVVMEEVHEKTLLFGLVRQETARSCEDHVRNVAFLLGGVGAQTVGLLLVLAFTAGFLPSFVDPNAALILLAKPVPRWFTLLGKVAGVLAFQAMHIIIFVVATWFALGIATGVWVMEYLWNVPALLLSFASFFSFSVLLAVVTRNTAACVIGAVLFWLLCWGMNLGRHLLVAHDLEHFSALSRWVAEFSYWALPKPADVCVLLYNALEPAPLSASLSDFATVQARNAFHPLWSIVASVVFPIVLVGIAAYELETADY